MTTTQMVAALDAEIKRLQQVRQLLAGTLPATEQNAGTRRMGTTQPGDGTKRKRTLSPEARERIAAAQRARWAAHAAAQSTGKPAKPGRAKGAKRAERETSEGAEGTA